MTEFKILNGNILNPVAFEPQNRVNITTNRVNKVNKNLNEYNIGEIFNLSTKGPYIWATQKQYDEFCTLNKDLLISIDNKSKKNKDEFKIKLLHDEIEEEVDLKKLKSVFNEDDPHTICKNNITNQPIIIPHTDDPHQLDIKSLLSLTNFHINGFEGNGVVTEVIDGDTVFMVVYVPLKALANGHEYSFYSKKGVRSFIHTRFLNAGFFAKIKCRLLNIDAMEKNTPEGVFAKYLTIDLYQRLQGKIYFEFPNGVNIEDTDKYGRTLVRIYKDKSKTIEYTNYLFQFNNINNNGIIIAEKYDGGTKSEYAKNLEKRSEAEKDRVRKILDTQLIQILNSNSIKQREVEVHRQFNFLSFFKFCF